MFKDYSDEIMNEILGGADGPVNKADNAVNFLNEWANYISEFINIIKNFFAEITAMLG
ncbi:MAG: hypothetical protein IJN70_01010 [Clostridia bacterium]|nr:hypothetical protein [Clostridia bacterium]